MKPCKGVLLSLVLLATCGDRNSIDFEWRKQALGPVPASEVATWKKLGAGTVPDERYLQSVAFDETRKLLVMFGGLTGNDGTPPTPRQDVWEWSPATGGWTERVATGTKPPARSGAGFVFDSARNKFVLFGGCAASGSDYQDTWEWDPTTGKWTDRTSAAALPSARCQAAMVFEKWSGKILLFGGGRSKKGDTGGISMSVSLGDTWEWDGTTGAWTARTVTSGPTGRFAASLAWEEARKRAVLFAGIRKEDAGLDGVARQDTWEWDAEAGTWTERTSTGDKPSPRWGQAAAFDGIRGQLVVFGGGDSNGYLNDVWDWNPSSGAWTQRRMGTEPNLPTPRIYASLIFDNGAGRLELVAGMSSFPGTGGESTGAPVYLTGVSSREVWELEPVAPAFSQRADSLHSPGRRSEHAMAYCPDTGKVYAFGGVDEKFVVHNDLWEWDGEKWSLVAADTSPPARTDAALAYDPARQSLILFGGSEGTSINGHSEFFKTFSDTWEWHSATRKWSELLPATNPGEMYGHGMVTDSARRKIFLFGGALSANGGYDPNPGIEPIRNDIWEWDGSKVTWTNRSPMVMDSYPSFQLYPVMGYDQGRQKLLLFMTASYYVTYGATNSAFWEWDPLSSAWSTRDPGDSLDAYATAYAAYDSSRRRTVLYSDAVSPFSSPTSAKETRELDSEGPTWYLRNSKTAPGVRHNAAMTYDGKRGVLVLFGGTLGNTGFATDETWEYSVTGLGNGSGCSTGLASLCASGNCVDGVCCESASCSGPCQSCRVSGKEGTCVPVPAGTEVAGSCSDGQDGATGGQGATTSSGGMGGSGGAAGGMSVPDTAGAPGGVGGSSAAGGTAGTSGGSTLTGGTSSASDGSGGESGGAGRSGGRDAGVPTGSRIDAGSATRLGNKGCACSLGRSASRAPVGLPLAMVLGLLLGWRRKR
jgi:N-acetylneuraminic acid mutarotase